MVMAMDQGVDFILGFVMDENKMNGKLYGSGEKFDKNIGYGFVYGDGEGDGYIHSDGCIYGEGIGNGSGSRNGVYMEISLVR